MNKLKITSILAGISLLAASIVPTQASAANAVMSLSGSTQTNGTFSTIVYENAEGPVTSVYLAMSFSRAVTAVSYDYSVGPFKTSDPSGGHLVTGSVTGRQPVARVSFRLANPGTVTATVDTTSSYVKGVNGTTLVKYSLNAASADFTYNAPVVNNPAPSNGGGSKQNDPVSNGTNNAGNPAGSTTKKTVATTSNPDNATAQVEGDSTTAAAADDEKKETKSENKDKKSDDKKDDTKNASSKSGLGWTILAIVAIIFGFLFGRRYVAAKAAAKARADAAAAAAAASQKKATKKSQAKGKSGKSKTAAKGKK